MSTVHMPNGDPNTPEGRRLFYFGVLVDCMGLLMLGTLLYNGKVTAAEALPWFALILGARLPVKGGSGVFTIMAGAFHPIVRVAGALAIHIKRGA